MIKPGKISRKKGMNEWMKGVLMLYQDRNLRRLSHKKEYDKWWNAYYIYVMSISPIYQTKREYTKVGGHIYNTQTD